MLKRKIHPRKPKIGFNEREEKRTKYSRGFIVWRFLKAIIFLCCLAVFFYQSADFLQVYYKYPTTKRIEFTYPEKFLLPAFTLCNSNIMKRNIFCTEYPSFCDSPENITSFCEENPFMCQDNPSNIMIPDYSVADAKVSEIYFSGNITDELWKEWVWRIKQPFLARDNFTLVFVPENPPRIVPCYSINLRLDSPDDPKTIFKSSTTETLERVKDSVYDFEINLPRSEQFFFEDEGEVHMAIHSPFVPVNPLRNGWRLKPGYHYNIFIKLEEEHLLPHPYETNCTDYKDLWMKNNKKGPRSQEMCKEFCRHDLFQTTKRSSYDQELDFQLLEYPLKMCSDCPIVSSKDQEIYLRCRRECKASCRNLQYTSNVVETLLVNYKKDWNEAFIDKIMGVTEVVNEIDLIIVEIFFADRQVVVKRHVPEYGTGDIFSYIGGLMGCWLGVSIWSLAGLAEYVFRRFLH